MSIDHQIQRARNDFDRDANRVLPKRLLLGKKQTKEYKVWANSWAARQLKPSTSHNLWRDIPIVETEAEDQLAFE